METIQNEIHGKQTETPAEAQQSYEIKRKNAIQNAKKAYGIYRYGNHEQMEKIPILDQDALAKQTKSTQKQANENVHRHLARKQGRNGYEKS